MRFNLLLLALTSLFTPSLTSSTDVLYIEKLTADFAIALDTKNFKAFEIEFIPTATYDPGSGPVTGFANIEKTLAAIVANNVTQNSLTTQSISLAPPFDNQGGAGTASAITYADVAFLGKGPLAGKAFVFFGLFKDKFVKTGDFANYGGWKFSSRVFQSLVSLGARSIPVHTHTHTHGFLAQRGLGNSWR